MDLGDVAVHKGHSVSVAHRNCLAAAVHKDCLAAVAHRDYLAAVVHKDCSDAAVHMDSSVADHKDWRDVAVAVRMNCLGAAVADRKYYNYYLDERYA